MQGHGSVRQSLNPAFDGGECAIGGVNGGEIVRSWWTAGQEADWTSIEGRWRVSLGREVHHISSR